jgi:hypothetical protein
MNIRLPSSILATAFALGVLVAGMVCTRTPVQEAGGGGTETVIGTVRNSDGTAAQGTVVKLLPSDYNPVAPGADSVDASIDTTGEAGTYTFDGLHPGSYTLTAVNRMVKTRAINVGIVVEKGIVNKLVDTLHSPGTMKIAVPAGADTSNGYFYIPGTDVAVTLYSGADTIVLDSVPSGRVPAVNYAVRNRTGQDTIRCNVEVAPGDTVTIVNSGWKFTRHIYFNTSSSGAQVTANLLDFPVLIRLNGGNFDFSQAQAAGGDIRFTKGDNTPLAYEIERWDASQDSAEIWVRIDTLFGNDSTHGVSMFWGNTGAASASNGPAVFDTSNAFQAVWHLGEAGGAITSDATVNHYDGMPKNMTAASAVNGMIGGAQKFNGTSSYIQMPGTAYSTLDFPLHGVYSVSAWVNTDLLDSTYRMIVSKGDYQYSLELMNNYTWEFAENEDNLGWDVTNAPATAKTWTYVVGIRNGTSQYLYVDGVCVDSSIQTIFPGTIRYTGFDIMIGKKVNSPDYFFQGMIDEVRISNRALNPDWIRLCYLNQRKNDALVIMR